MTMTWFPGVSSRRKRGGGGGRVTMSTTEQTSPEVPPTGLGELGGRGFDRGARNTLSGGCRSCHFRPTVDPLRAEPPDRKEM